MHKLRINPVAKNDLQEIKEYISKELLNPDAATKMEYEQLKEFARLGLELSSKLNIITDYRFLILGDYIVFYKIDDEYVSIYRIIYARRDYLKLLFTEEENLSKSASQTRCAFTSLWLQNRI